MFRLVICRKVEVVSLKKSKCSNYLYAVALKHFIKNWSTSIVIEQAASMEKAKNEKKWAFSFVC